MSETYLVFEDVGVPHDSGVVRSHPIVVGEHLLLVIKLCIGAEVVGKVCRLCFLISIEGRNLSSIGSVHKIGCHGLGKPR